MNDLLERIDALLARVPEGYTEGPLRAEPEEDDDLDLWLVRDDEGCTCFDVGETNARLYAAAPDIHALLLEARDEIWRLEEQHEQATKLMEECLIHSGATLARADRLQAALDAERGRCLLSAHLACPFRGDSFSSVPRDACHARAQGMCEWWTPRQTAEAALREEADRE